MRGWWGRHNCIGEGPNRQLFLMGSSSRETKHARNATGVAVRKVRPTAQRRIIGVRSCERNDRMKRLSFTLLGSQQQLLYVYTPDGWCDLPLGSLGFGKQESSSAKDEKGRTFEKCPPGRRAGERHSLSIEKDYKNKQ